MPQTAQTAVTVPYTAAQTAGNLNVVIAGWNDSTAKVSSVKDSSGNTYQLAVGPTAVTELFHIPFITGREFWPQNPGQTLSQ